MTKYIGRLVNVGLGKESSRGTPVAAAWWLPKSTVAFSDKAMRQLGRLNYGSIGDSTDAPTAFQWAEGSIEGDVFDKSFGYLLLGLLGTDTPSGPAAGAYTHTFTLANTNTHQSLTLTLSDPDRGDLYPLTMIDKIEINAIPDDVVTFKGDLMARTGRPIASQTPDYTAENKFLGRHVHIKVASLTGGLAAASEISVKQLKLVIANNVKKSNVLGTVWPDDLVNTNFELTGTLTLDLVDQTYRNYMLDGSYKALRIQMTNTDIVIAGGATNPSFTLDLSRVMFDAWDPNRPNDELVTQKISFRALWDTQNGNIINSCILINGKASY